MPPLEDEPSVLVQLTDQRFLAPRPDRPYVHVFMHLPWLTDVQEHADSHLTYIRNKIELGIEDPSSNRHASAKSRQKRPSSAQRKRVSSLSRLARSQGRTLSMRLSVRRGIS